MASNKILCQSLHTHPVNDEINRFVNIGHIPNSTHVFECGTLVNGKAEINAYINANGTCSFINADAVTFTGLADVPHHYQSHANYALVVGEDENCLRFSDKLKMKSIESEFVKVKVVETDTLHVKDRFKVDHLEINQLVQSGYSDNNLAGFTHMNKAEVDNLSCVGFKANTGKITGNLDIEGDLVAKTLNVKGIHNTGKTILGEVSGTEFLMDILECECNARIKALEVADTLSVYGTCVAKTFNSNTITNTGNLVSHDIKAISSTFESISTDIIKTEKILTKSELIFGKVEYPQVFLPNEKRYINIDLPMKGLRGHGYGYSPTQVLDTIIVKIQTEHKLDSCDLKIGFSYYNTKSTFPTVYKLGEVVYAENDYIIALVKLSSNLPLAPYWTLTVDINPF
tara:strand:+ start:4269 stop:5465 length:1197 start_codon:yes stop_codon:yes gene_type:complete